MYIFSHLGRRRGTVVDDDHIDLCTVAHLGKVVSIAGFRRSSAHCTPLPFLRMAKRSGRRRPDISAAMRASWSRRGEWKRQISRPTRFEMVRRRLSGQSTTYIGTVLHVDPQSVTNWTDRFLRTGTLLCIGCVRFPPHSAD